MDHRHLPVMENVPSDLPLSSESLYSYELHFVPTRVSYSTEHDALVERARQGDEQAKEEMILLCLRYVAKVADTFYKTLHHSLDDRLDLIAIGNLALVERLDYALTKDRPFPVLYKAAEGQIWTHCKYHSMLVTLPEHSYALGQSPATLSLDMPVGDGSFSEIVDAKLALRQEASGKRGNPFLSLLDEAIATQLTPLERQTIELTHGLLDGQEPLTKAEIGRRIGRTESAAKNIYHRGVQKLRRCLEQRIS